MDAATFVIGVVGRLENVKGIDVLVRAYMKANLTNSRLVIIGEGSERGRLQALADGNADVDLLGFRPNVKRYYPLFDLFVLPSRHEPFGLVLLEAMSAGLPIVYTDTPGPREILDGQRARCVPVDDAEALQYALEQAHEQGRARQAYDLSRYVYDARIADINGCYRAVARPQ